jgi:energy-coupling factor transporter ATP-binding protein EcfA2
MNTVLQVVDDDGEYQEQAVEAFLRDQQLDAAGVNYQIIAIMGPQSSGKSTLMNAVVRPLRPSNAPRQLERCRIPADAVALGTRLTGDGDTALCLICSMRRHVWQCAWTLLHYAHASEDRCQAYLLTLRCMPSDTQFSTSFAEMDALSGRNQTTKGIWLARSPKVSSGSMLSCRRSHNRALLCGRRRRCEYCHPVSSNL